MGSRRKKNLAESEIAFWATFPVEKKSGSPPEGILEQVTLFDDESDEEVVLPAIRERLFSSELKELTGAIIEHVPANAEVLTESEEEREHSVGVPEVRAETAPETKPEATVERESAAETEEKAQEVSAPAGIQFISGYEEDEIDWTPRRSVEGDLMAPLAPPYEIGLMEALDTLTAGGENTNEAFRVLNRHILRQSGGDSLVWMAMDRHYVAQRVLFDFGVDPITHNNLFLGVNEPFLDPHNNVQIVPFHGSLASDINFRKRFSSDFFLKHDAALFLSLHPHNLLGYLVIFFRNREGLDGEAVHKSLHQLMGDLCPVLNRERAREWPENELRPTHHNILRTLHIQLKEVTSHRKDPVQAVYLQMDQLLEESSWKTILAECVEVLSHRILPEERLFLPAPHRITFLLKHSRLDPILDDMEELGRRWGFQVRVRISRFPEDGYNLFNFVRSLLYEPES